MVGIVREVRPGKFIFTERCPYCGGNLFFEQYEYGEKTMKCLMCSRERQVGRRKLKRVTVRGSR